MNHRFELPEDRTRPVKPKTKPYLLGICFIFGWAVPCFFVFALLADFCRETLSVGIIAGLPLCLWLVGVYLAGIFLRPVRDVLTSVLLELLLINCVTTLLCANAYYYLPPRETGYALALAELAFVPTPFMLPGFVIIAICLKVLGCRRPQAHRAWRWLLEFLVLGLQARGLCLLLPS